jgi:hypothetical protein
LPVGAQIQGRLSLHEKNSSPWDASAVHGPAHESFGSSHRSIAQRIRPLGRCPLAVAYSKELSLRASVFAG